MSWPSFICLFGAGVIVGFASSDWRVEPTEPTPEYEVITDPVISGHPPFEEMSPEEREQSTCYALVPRHQTYSVALNQGVTCISVLGVTDRRSQR